MRHLHIVMPMAGEGSRFLKEGWTTPKPLIDLNGQPLFKHAISSVLDKEIPMKYSLIVRQEHINKYQIDNRIKSFLPEYGQVGILCITDKQFGQIELFYGKKSQEINAPGQQLELF